MLVQVREMKLTCIGLFLSLLSITYSQNLVPFDQCVAAAYCQMIYGDVLKVANDKIYLEKYMEGKHLLKRHFKYVACGVEQINKNCEITLNECIQNVQTEAIETLKIPSKLIYGCEIETLPYMLFLCQNINNWPNTTDFPKDFKTCHGSCSLIIEYNQFHLSHGKKESDFPKNWAKNIKSQEIYNKMAQDDKMKVYTSPQNKSRKLSKSSEEWSLDSYMEPNNQDKLGTYTTDSDIFCQPFSYFVSTMNELPHRFLGHCQENSTNTTYGNDQIYDPGYYPEKEIYDAHCTKQHGRPDGSFIIGMKFIIKNIIVPDPNSSVPIHLKYLSNVSYLCSGHDWSPFKVPIDQKTEILSPELICPYLTAICSLRFKRYIQGKYNMITNIKIGCCTMPDDFGYSGVTQVDRKYNYYINGANPPQIWINTYFDRETITQSYCPFGQFIDRFDLSRVYFHVKTHDSKHYIGVIKNIFYCNNLDKNDQKPLDDTLYNYLHKYSKVWDGETDDLGSHNCTNGFYKGGSVQISTSKGYAVYNYKMICSFNDEEVVGEWNGNSGNHWQNNVVYNGYDNDEYKFRCPDHHGICGLKSIQNFYYPSPRSYITLHGLVFTFICCPIPNFLISRDCGKNGLGIDVEKSREYGFCGEVDGRDRECQVTHTIGYDENIKSDDVDLKRNLLFLKGFGWTKHDMLTSIITNTHRDLGLIANQLISNIIFNQQQKNKKTILSRTKSKRQKRTPLTLTSILLNLTSQIRVGHVHGFSNNIPNPGKDGLRSNKVPFKNAQFKNSITLSSKNTTQQIYTVYYEQPTLFYDVFLTCGPFKIYADSNIRYIGSTLGCIAVGELEYIGYHNEPNDSVEPLVKLFTVQGYGLYIDDIPRHGLVLDINWVHITAGVKELFENNPRLDLHGNGIDVNVFSGTNDSLWESYNPNILFQANVTFQPNHIGLVYRVVASCGKYKVFTGEFITIIGHKDQIDIDKVPKSRVPPFTETNPPTSI